LNDLLEILFATFSTFLNPRKFLGVADEERVLSRLRESRPILGESRECILAIKFD
jgi:hypothetical protein